MTTKETKAGKEKLIEELMEEFEILNIANPNDWANELSKFHTQNTISFKKQYIREYLETLKARSIEAGEASMRKKCLKALPAEMEIPSLYKEGHAYAKAMGFDLCLRQARENITNL